MTPPPRPTFADCWAAARSIRSSDHWRQVRTSLRPRGFAMLRSRGPISAQLFLAAHDGELVWRGPDKLTWVARHDRPQSDRRPLRVLRFLTSYWAVAWMAVPASFFVAAVVAALLQASLTAVILLGIGYALIIAAFTVGAIAGLLSMARLSASNTAVDQLERCNPMIRLLHAPDRNKAFDLLAAARQTTGTTRPMLVHRHGITAGFELTGRRRSIRVESLAASVPLFVVRGPGNGVPRVPVEPGRLRWFDVGVLLAATVGLIAVFSTVVAEAEGQRCTAAGSCDGIPASYRDALYWLISRLLGGDPDGLGAIDGFDRSIGVFFTVWGVYVLATIIGRVAMQYIDAHSRSAASLVEDFAARARRRPPTRRRRVAS